MSHRKYANGLSIGQAQDRMLIYDFTLVTDFNEVTNILEYLGRATENRAAKYGIGGLFVKEDRGDYETVYGFYGIIPENRKALIRLR